MVKDVLKRGTALLVFVGLAPASTVYAQNDRCYARAKTTNGSWYATLGNSSTRERRIMLTVKPSALRDRAPSYLFQAGGRLEIEYAVPAQGNPVLQHVEMTPPYTARGSTVMYYSLQVAAGRYRDTFTGTEYLSSVASPPRAKPETLDFRLFAADNLRADSDGLITGRFKLRSLTEVDFDGKETKVNAAPFSGTIEYRISDLNEAYAQALGGFRDLERKLVDGECYLSRPPRQRACFLTTATVETIGLSDDCWELEAMRKFRDGWLANQPGGKARIAAYYAHAPAICDRLNQEPAKLIKLYWTRILPSALAAKVGANRLSNLIYTRMVNELGVRV